MLFTLARAKVFSHCQHVWNIDGMELDAVTMFSNSSIQITSLHRFCGWVCSGW